MPRRRSSTSAPVALAGASRSSLVAMAMSVADAGGQRVMRFGSSVEQFAYAGDHLAAVELDHGHPLVVRDASDRVVQVEPAQVERGEDLCDSMGAVLGEPTYIEPRSTS